MKEKLGTMNSRIPRTDELTHKVCLADTKLSPFIDITLFDTETKKLKCPPKTTMTLYYYSLTCILYTSVLTFAHISHIYNNNTSTLSSRLGIRETYHLFHYASLHSAEDNSSFIFG